MTEKEAKEILARYLEDRTHWEREKLLEKRLRMLNQRFTRIELVELAEYLK